MLSLVQRIFPKLCSSPILPTARADVPPSNVGQRPLLRPPSGRSIRKNAIIEPTTGPFDLLSGRSVLVALDLENIDRSAHDIGRVLDYGRLAKVLRDGIGGKAHLIAVFSCSGVEVESEHVLRAAGWATYTRQIDTVRTRARVIRHANADVALATAVGAATIALYVEALVLATGDGQLALDVARCIRSIAPSCKLAATLSLPGSTSHRLDARRGDVFAANLEIGDDVMNCISGAQIRRSVPTRVNAR